MKFDRNRLGIGCLIACSIIACVTTIFLIADTIRGMFNSIASPVSSTSRNSTVKSNSPKPHENPLSWNSYNIFSYEARTYLKYRPGIDTEAYWGNGRYSIMIKAFWDNKTNMILVDSVVKYDYKPPRVFLYTDRDVRVFNLLTKEFEVVDPETSSSDIGTGDKD